MLPIDRTAKAVLDANLVNGILSDGPKIKAADDVIYNTIDELYNYTNGLISAGTLSRLGLINVKDYGAKGDGVTDDSASIQAAINAVQNAKSKSLYIPNGNYLISTRLLISKSIRITGDGTSRTPIEGNDGNRGTTLIANFSEFITDDWSDSGSTNTSIQYRSLFRTPSYVDEVQISNMTIVDYWYYKGLVAPPAAQYRCGLFLQSLYGKVSNVDFVGFYLGTRNNFYLVEYENCRWIENGIGISLYPSAGANISNTVRFNKCQFFRNAMGLRGDTLTALTLEDFDIEANGRNDNFIAKIVATYPTWDYNAVWLNTCNAVHVRGGYIEANSKNWGGAGTYSLTNWHVFLLTNCNSVLFEGLNHSASSQGGSPLFKSDGSNVEVKGIWGDSIPISTNSTAPFSWDAAIRLFGVGTNFDNNVSNAWKVDRNVIQAGETTTRHAQIDQLGYETIARAGVANEMFVGGASNLLINGSFEDHNILGWETYTRGAGTVGGPSYPLNISNGFPSYYGEWSLSLPITTPAVGDYAGIRQRVRLKKYMPYTFSISNQQTRARLRIVGITDTTLIYEHNLENVYTQAIQFIAYADGWYWLEVSGYSGSGIATLLMDNIQLVEGSKAYNYIPHSYTRMIREFPVFSAAGTIFDNYLDKNFLFDSIQLSLQTNFTLGPATVNLIVEADLDNSGTFATNIGTVAVTASTIADPVLLNKPIIYRIQESLNGNVRIRIRFATTGVPTVVGANGSISLSYYKLVK